MTLALRVFADPALLCDVTTPNLTIRSYRTPAEVIKALAFLRWTVGTAAVVDLGLHGLLGADVVDYITSRHPMVGLWGVPGLCAGDVVGIVGGLNGPVVVAGEPDERARRNTRPASPLPPYVDALEKKHRRLLRALKKLADEADLTIVTKALMQEVSDLTGMAWDDDGRP